MPSTPRKPIAALVLLGLTLAGGCWPIGRSPLTAIDTKKRFLDPINVNPPLIATDKAVKYDYDIVYVRAPRKGDEGRTIWADIAHPALTEPNADLMLLHPDGTEEVLVRGGSDGAIVDPSVSLDGQSVFYSHIQGLKNTSQHGQPPHQGADIYKVQIKSRKVVQLTHGEYTPNTGAGNWSKDCRAREKDKNYFNYGALNLGPCPLPNGRLVFVSNRNGFRPPKHPSPCLQLFTMDDDGKNVECIGHLNLGMALHPVVLKDGRIMFSSLESQGLRSSILWGLWSIHPDGTNWGPMISAFLPGEGAPNAFHFQTQLSDGSIVAEEYYNQNNSGFGTYLKLPPQAAAGYAPFGPGYMNDPRNPPLRDGRHYNGLGTYRRLPFSPFGVESLTRFAPASDQPAGPSVLGKKDSPAVGKFTHPAAAPDNHLLTVWSPGPANHQYKHLPMIDGGLYLIKDGKPIDEPGQMLLIKNDPKYNEMWPRAAGFLQADLRHRSAEGAAGFEERRQAVAAFARGYAVRPGRHFQLLQARKLSQRRCAGRKRDSYLCRRPGLARLPWSGPVQHLGERRLAQLGQPGRRRRPLQQRRDPRGPHPGDGADHGSAWRSQERPALSQPCPRTVANPRRNPAP